jgi:serine/threonine protein kinase
MFGPLEVFFYACEIVCLQCSTHPPLFVTNDPDIQIMGLRFLHDIGIVHRNVSPDTVLFDRQGHIILSGVENGVILNPSRKDFQDAQRGKNQYQAPEILLGWRHDFLVDSWSFGMVLYYMFHGKVKFYFNSLMLRV